MSSFWERCKDVYAGRRGPPPLVEAEQPIYRPPPRVEEPKRVVAVEPEPLKPLTVEPAVAVTKSQKIAAGIAAACLVAAPLATNWEGYAARVYNDPAHIPTYCYGETTNVDPSRIYSKSMCADLLRTRMAQDYAPRVARCAPGIVGNRFVFGALIDASYNAGWAAVCKSRMVASINAGQLRAGCEGFAGWYVTARDRRTGQRIQLKGLVSRRLDERAVCLRGVA